MNELINSVVSLSYFDLFLSLANKKRPVDPYPYKSNRVVPQNFQHRRLNSLEQQSLRWYLSISDTGVEETKWVCWNSDCPSISELSPNVYLGEVPGGNPSLHCLGKIPGWALKAVLESDLGSSLASDTP